MGVEQAHSFGGELVEVGRGNGRCGVQTAQVSHAQVVSQDDDDMGPCLLGFLRTAGGGDLATDGQEEGDRRDPERGFQGMLSMGTAIGGIFPETVRAFDPLWR